MENGLVKVVSPIDDTPAAKAGVSAGDLITQLDGEAVQGLTLQRRGREDARPGRHADQAHHPCARAPTEPFDVAVIRDSHQGQGGDVPAREGDIGYIRITSFTEQTYDGLRDARSRSSRSEAGDKLKGYVLDLRNNPGGLLDQAVAVSDAFLDQGEIVSTRGRDPRTSSASTPGPATSSRPADGRAGQWRLGLARRRSSPARCRTIAARSCSAPARSARARCRPSSRCPSNGAMRLTTALYYTPSGRSIQGKGITPDIEVDQPLPPKRLQGRDVTRGESDLKGHQLPRAPMKASRRPPAPQADAARPADQLRHASIQTRLPAQGRQAAAGQQGRSGPTVRARSVRRPAAARST